MMSLINTNKDYLSTMGIAEDDPMVGIIVSVYYCELLEDLQAERLSIDSCV